jgi:MMPL family
LFCIAFGLSMDYEVFLMSRIREYWVRSRAARPATADAGANNDQSVALGVARSARVITAAALVMSISFAALIAAHVQFMRLFGVGMTLAVVVDATLVRLVLVPAFMRVLGRWNWWAPKSLARLHERFGIDDRAMVVAHPAETEPWKPERDLHPAGTVAAGRHRATATRVAFGHAGPRALHERRPPSRPGRTLGGGSIVSRGQVIRWLRLTPLRRWPLARQAIGLSAQCWVRSQHVVSYSPGTGRPVAEIRRRWPRCRACCRSARARISSAGRRSAIDLTSRAANYRPIITCGCVGSGK